ncbi:hypothetical protein INR49_031064 [Caranx melampygus]|nr:hypothetical protein INR49_031064 [Caranx melampygus]
MDSLWNSVSSTDYAETILQNIYADCGRVDVKVHAVVDHCSQVPVALDHLNSSAEVSWWILPPPDPERQCGQLLSVRYREQLNQSDTDRTIRFVALPLMINYNPYARDKSGPFPAPPPPPPPPHMESPELGGDSATMQFCANKLDKKDFFGKSDPFMVFYRSNEDGTFTICHKTEVVKNTLNPVWQPFTIPVRALCNGDYDSPVQNNREH